jgi:hypothetical protein
LEEADRGEHLESRKICFVMISCATSHIIDNGAMPQQTDGLLSNMKKTVKIG